MEIRDPELHTLRDQSSRSRTEIHSPAMSIHLTPEQTRRMEENRRKALERRAQLQAERAQGLGERAQTTTADPGTQAAAVSAAVTPSPAKRRNITTSGKCVGHSVTGRFRVEVGYHVELIQVFRSIPTRHYVRQVASINSVCLEPLEGILEPEASTSEYAGSIAPLLKLSSLWKRNKLFRKTAECVLVSLSRFHILPEIVSVFSTKVTDVFKLMPSHRAEAEGKWSFSLKDYKPLMDLLTQMTSARVEPLPRQVVEAFCRRFEDPHAETATVPEADLSAIDPVLSTSLLPFQRIGVNFGVHQGGRLLLADDMGLGKTIQAIAIAAFYRSEWPLLVVTPSSIRFTWAQAFKRWMPSLQSENINVMVKSTDNISSGLVNIVSYSLLRRAEPEPGIKVIIVDESHFLKNNKTARYKAALPLLQAAKRVILLSGTPALARPSELYTQIQAVRPKLFPKFKDYAERYCQGHKTEFTYDASGSCHLEELKLLLEQCLMLRRLKSEVLSQLPPKQRHVVTVNVQGINDQLKNAMSVADKKIRAGNLSKKETRETMFAYYSYTADAKLQSIIEYIKDIMQCGKDKFLVFAHHRFVMDRITAELTRKKKSFIRIDGSTPSAERLNLCEQFQQSIEPCVAVLSITTANTGLTLTAADLVIFAELSWSPGTLIQAEDRVHRIGQTNDVNIHYLVAQDTADDHMWDLIQKKIEVLKKVGLCDGDFLKDAIETSFTEEDLQESEELSQNTEVCQSSMTEEDEDDSEEDDNINDKDYEFNEEEEHDEEDEEYEDTEGEDEDEGENETGDEEDKGENETGDDDYEGESETGDEEDEEDDGGDGKYDEDDDPDYMNGEN
uniref:SWI/SNF-related matrix-associated actin-dependent regulator of chromatin subfamily A-like protein 1 n=1 Tax=Knipowitschia caucasica TaxID=637954 RepID=A0AAV2JCX5_KNICA